MMVKTSGIEILAPFSILFCHFLSNANCKPNITIDPRIIDGTDASGNKHSLAYQAIVVRLGWHSPLPTYWPYYGGAIIGEIHVLTCAHCVTEIPAAKLKVSVGNAIVDLNDRRFDKEVEKIIIHEQYNNKTKLNDIALLKMVDRFTWTEHLKPIDLLTVTIVRKDYVCTISGYGKTGKTEDMSFKLLFGLVYLKDAETCKKEVGTDDTQLCTLHTHKGGICGGDAGDPLKCADKLAGVVSYTTRECEPAGSTGYTAYSEVAKYIKWMKAHGYYSTRTQGTASSFASLNATSSPVLNFIALLVILFIGKIVKNL